MSTLLVAVVLVVSPIAVAVFRNSMHNRAYLTGLFVSIVVAAASYTWFSASPTDFPSFILNLVGPLGAVGVAGLAVGVLVVADVA